MLRNVMSEGYNFKKLKSEILPLSKATDWEVARKEWAFINFIEVEEPEVCLCGHSPIYEICEIHNRLTGHTTEVGNVCVKRFLGLRSDLVFSCIKRIRKDQDKSLNADTLTFFHGKNLLSDWEYNFTQSTMKKAAVYMTAKQIKSRRSINMKILRAIKKRGFQGNVDLSENKDG